MVDTDPDSPDPAFPDAVEELFARCMESPEAERRAAFESARREHPELAEELTARLEALRSMGIAVFPIEGDADPDFPERLGDFELLRRLGGGGMGVVYEARQTSLGRVVALKLIRPEHLYFPGARQRFRRETEAVARLQHPGIVAIYTVGEEGGVPYFAMERIRGATLGEVLESLRGSAPESLHGADLAKAVGQAAGEEVTVAEGSVFAETWPRACLGIARQVAEALQHAHGRGIVHRDVKPSNVALTVEGRALLLDFGLTTGDGERVTRTGSQLGTLPYMPPEQVQGARDLDGRADVYSLGVTLYELMTLQLPFREEHSTATVRRILEGRPDPIRVRNRSVPVDAETVCLHAMDAEPQRRYATASDLARDIGNVLALRPIEARPPGAVLRARRWLQRHPAATTALLGGLALLGGIPTALYFQQRGHAEELRGAYGEVRSALDKERVARREADREREAAQRAREATQAALDQEQVARAEAEEEREATEGALRYLGSLFASTSPFETPAPDIPASLLLDRGVRRITDELGGLPRVQARLRLMIGQVYYDLRRFPEGADLVEQALAHYEARSDPRARKHLGEAKVLLGGFVGLLGDMQRSERLLHEGLAIAEELDDTDLRLQALNRLAGTLYRLEHLEEAREVYEELMQAYEQGLGSRDAQATNCLGYAQLLADTGDSARADELALRAQEILERDLPPGHPRRVQATITRAAVARQAGRVDEALRLAREAQTAAVAVWGEDSEAYASCLNLQADLLELQGRVIEAEPLFRRSLGIVRASVGERSVPAVYAMWNLARVVGHLGDQAESAELARQALELASELFGSRDPRTIEIREVLVFALARQERLADALPHVEEILEAVEGVPGQEFRVVDMLVLRGRRQREAGDHEAARADWESALRIARERLGPQSDSTRSIEELLAELSDP